MKTVIINDENPPARTEEQDRFRAPHISVIDGAVRTPNKFLICALYMCLTTRHLKSATFRCFDFLHLRFIVILGDHANAAPRFASFIFYPGPRAEPKQLIAFSSLY